MKVIMFFRKRKQICEMCEVFETGEMTPNAKRGGKVEFQYVKAANREMVLQVSLLDRDRNYIKTIHLPGICI